jgi:hypothetical protein
LHFSCGSHALGAEKSAVGLSNSFVFFIGVVVCGAKHPCLVQENIVANRNELSPFFI